MPNYLDAAEFTRLFHRRHANRQAIAACLQLIAQETVRRFSAVTCQDLEDAASAATLTALRKIGTFDVRRPGANAFSYYTSVIMRAIARELKVQAQKRERDRQVAHGMMLSLLSSNDRAVNVRISPTDDSANPMDRCEKWVRFRPEPPPRTPRRRAA